MENYRDKSTDTWYVTICRHKETGKIHIYAFVCNFSEPKTIVDSQYQPLQIAKIKNTQALLFLSFYNKIPTRDTQYKFDLFKYVGEADLDDTYRNEFKK